MAQGCAIAEPLYLTDQEALLPLMRENIRLNELGGKVVAEVLDWAAPPPDTLPRAPDIILAADCVYFEPSFPLLQRTLAALMGPKTTVYFCFKKRRRADMRFMKLAQKMFTVREVEDDPDRDLYKKENISL